MSELLTVLRFAGTLLLVLLIFNFVILVHEWGHFLAARWRGLKIEKFQIWMGKPIWKKTYNGVQYGLGSLPIGGFVALPQMAPMEAIEGKSAECGAKEKLAPIKPADKIIVAFAGPLFSALLALFFAVLVSIFGKPQHAVERTTVIGYMTPDGAAAKSDLKLGDRILKIDGREVAGFFGAYGSVQWGVASSENNPIEFLVERPGVAEPVKVMVDAPVGAGVADLEWEKESWWTRLWGRPPLRMVGISPAVDVKIKSMMKDSPAVTAGLREGDRIVAVEGQPVLTLQPLWILAEKKVGQPIALGVDRGGQRLNLTLIPRKPVPEDSTRKLPDYLDKGMTGIGEVEPANGPAIILERPNPFRLLYSMGANSLSNLRAMVMPGSGVKLAHMSGPVGIMNAYYEILQGQYAWRYVLFFSVMLNIGLAIFNMLPLPVLDGGHITMALLEMIRGKAASIKVLEVVQTACVLMLLCFVAFVTLKDVGGLRGEKEVKYKFLPPPAAEAAPGAP